MSPALANVESCASSVRKREKWEACVWQEKLAVVVLTAPLLLLGCPAFLGALAPSSLLSNSAYFLPRPSGRSACSSCPS